MQPTYFLCNEKKPWGCNQSIFFFHKNKKTKKSLLSFLRVFKRLLRVLEAILVPLEVFTNHSNPLPETFSEGLIAGQGSVVAGGVVQPVDYF